MEIHDQVCGSVAHPAGFTIQELELDNISGQILDQYFLEPDFVEFITSARVMKTRIVEQPRSLLVLSPNARLQSLQLHMSFDLASIPNT